VGGKRAIVHNVPGYAEKAALLTRPAGGDLFQSQQEMIMHWMIYGANGYTGELIAREAERQGKTPILAGRSAAKIIALVRQLNLPSTVFRIEVPSEIVAALRGVRLVLNCAGPFSKTADPLMRACLAAKAHYLDIAGEIDVLEGAHRFDADAKAAGVVLCPGAGFDVVPTDCIALMLKKALLEATELAHGFEFSGRQMSAGTAKTLVDWAKAAKFAALAALSIVRLAADCAASILAAAQSWRCPFHGAMSPRLFTPRAFQTSPSSRQFRRCRWRSRD
jgi:Saccharopine dehydrogenase NADP binding domain